MSKGWYAKLDEQAKERERAKARARRAKRLAIDPEGERQRSRDSTSRHHDIHGRKSYPQSEAALAVDRERVRAWRSANPEYDRDRAARRRAAGGKVARHWLAVLARDPCSYCGQPGGAIDHVVPIALGGVHDHTNVVGACGSCNSRKGARSLLNFL